jgi:hypothetical protein
MGTGSPFPGVKLSRGVTLITHSHLVARSTSRIYSTSPPWGLHGDSGTVLIFHLKNSLNSISLFPVVALNINKLMVRQCTQLFFFFVLLIYCVYNHMFLHFFKTYKMCKIHKPLPVSDFHRPIIRSYQICELWIIHQPVKCYAESIWTFYLMLVRGLLHLFSVSFILRLRCYCPIFFRMFVPRNILRQFHYFFSLAVSWFPYWCGSCLCNVIVDSVVTVMIAYMYVYIILSIYFQWLIYLFIVLTYNIPDMKCFISYNILPLNYDSLLYLFVFSAM